MTTVVSDSKGKLQETFSLNKTAYRYNLKIFTKNRGVLAYKGRYPVKEYKL
jgi:hypothetical protein